MSGSPQGSNRPVDEADLTRLEHVVLIADGRPDNQGDVILAENVTWAAGGVPVRIGDERVEVGFAELRLDGPNVVATMRLDKSLISQPLAGFVPAISGMGMRDEETGALTNVDIVSIGFFERNADDRLMPFPTPQTGQ